MFNGIFKGLPARHVENANTRLEIRRDENQNQQRKKDSGADEEHESIPWDDTAYVSIASLKAFLESMVTANPEDATPAAPVSHEASNTFAHRAMSAYQTVGRRGHDQHNYSTSLLPPSPAPAASTIDTQFSEADIVRVRGFIHDLVELSRAGISELAMQKSATFLDSIEAAIAAAKA